MILDYQWPSVQPASTYQYSSNTAKRDFLYAQIEEKLLEIFQHPLVLLPSARAGLGSIFEFIKVSRSDVIFAPKYSSFCIWDVIGQIANPTIDLTNEVNGVLAVHKWGYEYKFNNSTKQQWVVEDSVDSIICDKAALFPLNGEFEVFSLPKLIGSYCGGVVVTKNTAYIDWIKSIRNADEGLISRQSKLKSQLLDTKNKDASFLYVNESKNRGIDIHGLEHIVKCLPNYMLNKKLILNRLDQLSNIFDDTLLSKQMKRLPCVYPVRVIPNKAILTQGLMQRYFNYTYNLHEKNYELSWLLPLHFTISDEVFNHLLDTIKKASI